MNVVPGLALFPLSAVSTGSPYKSENTPYIFTILQLFDLKSLFGFAKYTINHAATVYPQTKKQSVLYTIHLAGALQIQLPCCQCEGKLVLFII